MSLLSAAAFAVPVQSTHALLSCQGQVAGKDVQLDVFKLPTAYQALFVLQYDGQTQVLDATGGTFSECGTRTLPCEMVTSTQYSSNSPAMILTALYPMGAHTAHASLNTYPDGFGNGSKDGEVTCHVQ